MSLPLAIIMSACIGAVASVTTYFLFRFVEHQAAVRRILRGLVFEISSIMDLTETGPFVHRFDEVKRNAAHGEKCIVLPFVDSNLPLDPIFANALPNLGLLPPRQVSDILSFYRNLKLLRMQLRTLAEFSMQLEPEETLALCEEIEKHADEVKSRGRIVVNSHWGEALRSQWVS